MKKLIQRKPTAPVGQGILGDGSLARRKRRLGTNQIVAAPKTASRVKVNTMQSHQSDEKFATAL